MIGGKVIDLLTVVFASLAGALTIMKPFKKSRDGRGSWLALWNHYLGPNNVDNMATRACLSWPVKQVWH